MIDVVEQSLSTKPLFKGRKVIYTNYTEINDDNVVFVLNDTRAVFAVNAREIQYLWDYYRGDQPILKRIKEIRPEINNKIVENHAQEIVAFKLGYQFGEPLQYTCRRCPESLDKGESVKDTTDDEHLRQIDELNTLMFAEGKETCDRDLFEHMCICGQGYRMIEADGADDVEDGGAPFEIYTLDPRSTYIVYSSAYHHKPLMSVWVGVDSETNKEVYSIYTDNYFYRISGNEIIEKRNHTYGTIPIVEYPLNNARMGVFEPVLPLLDAINVIESNRLDGIEQTVQALMKFINCDIDEETFKDMLALGAVKVSTHEGLQSDVDIIKNDLDQTQTQVTKDDLYQAIVNICGMPNRNGTSGSSSDTGAAVLLRDGWTLAESHAKSYELQFKRAERNALRVVLKICELSSATNIKLRIRDIELAFNRRNYENILVKAQVLTTMLKETKIHPELAFTSCGMFTDPEAAYLQSAEYEKEHRDEISAQFENNSLEKIGSQATVPEPDKGDNAHKPANA